MSMRLLTTALLATALAGCVSYPSGEYRERVVYVDRYYAPEGDGYYAPEYRDDYYGYDGAGYGYGGYDYRYALGPIGYLGFSGFCSVQYRSCAPYWFGSYSYWPSYSRFGFSLAYGSGGWFAPWGYRQPYYNHGYYGGYGHRGGGYGYGYHSAPIYRDGRPYTPPRPRDTPPPRPPTQVVERPMPKPTWRLDPSRPAPRPLRPEPMPTTTPSGIGSDGEAAWSARSAPRARYREPMPPAARYREMPAPPSADVRPMPKPAYQEWRAAAPPERASPSPRREMREPEREAPAWREERAAPPPSSDGNEGAPRGRRRQERDGSGGG